MREKEILSMALNLFVSLSLICLIYLDSGAAVYYMYLV